MVRVLFPTPPFKLIMLHNLGNHRQNLLSSYRKLAAAAYILSPAALFLKPSL